MSLVRNCPRPCGKLTFCHIFNRLIPSRSLHWQTQSRLMELRATKRTLSSTERGDQHRLVDHFAHLCRLGWSAGSFADYHSTPAIFGMICANPFNTTQTIMVTRTAFSLQTVMTRQLPELKIILAARGAPDALPVRVFYIFVSNFFRNANNLSKNTVITYTNEQLDSITKDIKNALEILLERSPAGRSKLCTNLQNCKSCRENKRTEPFQQCVKIQRRPCYTDETLNNHRSRDHSTTCIWLASLILLDKQL